MVEKMLLAAVLDRQGNSHAVLVLRTDAADLVLEEVRRIAKERARGLTLDSNITELGLDSLMAVELRNRLSGRVGSKLPTTLDVPPVGASLLATVGSKLPPTGSRLFSRGKPRNPARGQLPAWPAARDGSRERAPG